MYFFFLVYWGGNWSSSSFSKIRSYCTFACLTPKPKILRGKNPNPLPINKEMCSHGLPDRCCLVEILRWTLYTNQALSSLVNKQTMLCTSDKIKFLNLQNKVWWKEILPCPPGDSARAHPPWEAQPQTGGQSYLYSTQTNQRMKFQKNLFEASSPLTGTVLTPLLSSAICVPREPAC